MYKLLWMTATDPLEMLAHLYPLRGLDSVEPQSRQSCHYLHACARRAWDRLPEVCRVIVALSERVYASPMPDRILQRTVYPHAEELVNCRGDAARVNAIGRELAALGLARPAQILVQEDYEPESWSGFAHLAYFPFCKTTPHYRRIPAELHSADLIREVFGNPFERQPPLNPAWRTADVMNLARQAYATGDFHTLQILADALEEAGCDRVELLNHFRSGVQHVRGCWALELVLAG